MVGLSPGPSQSHVKYIWRMNSLLESRGAGTWETQNASSSDRRTQAAGGSLHAGGGSGPDLSLVFPDFSEAVDKCACPY